VSTGCHHFRRIALPVKIIASLCAVVTFFAFMTLIFVSDANGQESANGSVAMSMLEQDDLVTSTSGYHAELQLTNTTGKDIRHAHLGIFINTSSLIAATQMQTWEDGGSTPSTRTELVPTQDLSNLSLPKNQQVLVDIVIPADSDGLKSIRSWGAKPVRFALSWDADSDGSDNDSTSQLRTYFVRTTDGLNIAQTPAMSIVPLLPLTKSAWEKNQDAITTLISTGFPDSTEGGQTELSTSAQMTWAARALTPSASEHEQLLEQIELAQKFPQIQTVADPAVANTANSLLPSLAGITQPYDFDITGYSDSPKLNWKAAGIDDSMFAATTSLGLLNAGGSPDKALLPIALEGSASWDTASLTLAKEQGYSVVIGDGDISTSATHAVLTGRQVVQTDEGPVTMLMTEPVLSTLAHNKPTDAQASGETTQAGRIARFIAQSAVYQMQRPYAARTLLVSFGADADPTFVESLMKSINGASWLTNAPLDSLVDLEATPEGMQPDTLGQFINDGTPFPLNGHDIPPSVSDRYTSAIKTLTGNSRTIAALPSNFFDTSTDSAGKDTKDSQALARQDADAKNPAITPDEWVAQLECVHSLLAFMSISQGNLNNSQSPTSIDSEIIQQIHDGVSIAPPKSINVMSQTASLPITVENGLPFPVRIQVLGTTDSNAITTADSGLLTVPANSEAQATLPITVVGSGEAKANLSLADTTGKIFSSVKTTQITVSLTLNDMSGNIILAFAGILAVFGLIRQFTRKKRRLAAEQRGKRAES
jgi:hypothetical protein